MNNFELTHSEEIEHDAFLKSNAAIVHIKFLKGIENDIKNEGIEKIVEGSAESKEIGISKVLTAEGVAKIIRMIQNTVEGKTGKEIG